MFGRPKCSLKILFGRPSRSLRLNCLGAQRASRNFSERATLQPFSYWKYGTSHAVVECGSAFFEEISKGNANLSELPHTLNIYGGNIDVTFVLRSNGTQVCDSSSTVY